jgi:hypothetical protein
VPNTKAVYSLVQVQTLVHYSAIMSLRAGQLLQVLEKHPLQTTQMQKIISFKTEIQSIGSIISMVARLQDGRQDNSAILRQDRNVSPSTKHPDQFLGPTTFLLKGYQGFNWGRGQKVAEMKNRVPGKGRQLKDA